MRQLIIEIDEFTIRMVGEKLAGTGVTPEDFLLNVAERALVHQIEEIKTWGETQTVMLWEDPGGGMHHSDGDVDRDADDQDGHPDDHDDDIPF